MQDDATSQAMADAAKAEQYQPLAEWLKRMAEAETVQIVPNRPTPPLPQADGLGSP